MQAAENILPDRQVSAAPTQVRPKLVSALPGFTGAGAERRYSPNYGKLPLRFEANQGQTDARVRFLARGGGYTIFLTDDEAVLALNKSSVVSPQSSVAPTGTRHDLVGRSADARVAQHPLFGAAALPDLLSLSMPKEKSENEMEKPRDRRAGPALPFSSSRLADSGETSAVLRMRLIGANASVGVTGADELPGKSNYFIGNDPKKWRTNVPNYAKVKYDEVYPGVDLVYYGNQRQLEYDFVVAPGADPSAIVLDVGAVRDPRTVAAVPDRRSAVGTPPLQKRASRPLGTPLQIAADGDLVVKIDEGEVRFHKPTVYQPASNNGQRTTGYGQRTPVDGHYILHADNQVGFKVASYDRTKPLVIDPVLSYSTYLGGSGEEEGYGIAVDFSGNAYVTGSTSSTGFPTVNPLQATYRGGSDAFVAKVAPGGPGPSVSFSALSLTFGPQKIGTTSAPQTVTVINSGTANLSISTVMVGGTNASDFAQSADTCTGATLIPNGTCTVSVTFTASARGIRNASLNFTDTASNSPQTVTLNGAGAEPLLSLSAPGLTFTNQLTSTTSAAQAETVSNPGTDNLTISTVTISGANAGDFAKSADTCTGATVTPNGLPCTISVTFTPSAGGSRSATLTFTDNASGSPQTVNLTGTGVDTAPAAVLSPSSLTFSSQSQGTTSPPQPVTLSNTGNAALTITSITIPGGLFGETDNCDGSVAAGASCTINVTFTPNFSGSLTFTTFLTISDNSNGVAGSTQTVTLTGTGMGPVLSLSAIYLSFSGQLVGTSSAAQTITLWNTGNAALTISGITISGDFSQTNTCGTSVSAPFGSCVIAVIFKPTAAGTRTGTLTISDNAGSPQNIALSGTGQDFTLAVASGSSTSATVAPGQSATYTLSVGSQGGTSGTVTFTCTGAPSEANCTVSPNPVTPGSSATSVTVTVTTTAPSVSAPRSRPLPPVPPLSPGLSGLLMLALVVAAIAWAVGRRNQRAVSRWQSTMVLLTPGLLLTLALAGCGGGGGGGGSGQTPNPGTPVGT